MKNTRFVLVFFLCCSLYIFAFSFVNDVKCDGYPFTSAEIKYNLSGIYQSDQVVSIGDVEITCIINIDVSDIDIAITYRLFEEQQSILPYGIPKSFIVLRIDQASSKNFEGYTITEGVEQYPFEIWFGLDLYMVTYVSGDMRVEMKWDKYKYILYNMDIYAGEDTVNKLTIKYVDSSLDIYEGYDESEINFIKFVRYITSLQGIVFISIIVVLSFVLIYMLKRYNKKEKMRKQSRGVTQIRLKNRRRGTSSRSRFGI